MDNPASIGPPPVIGVMAVAYQRPGPLKVLVQCFLNQTASNWTLTVIHDGPDEEFAQIMRGYRIPGKVEAFCTGARNSDFGHTLRGIGIEQAQSDYLLLTNDDNYYVPRFIEILTGEIQRTQADVILFDMVHSHDQPGGRPQPSYSLFQTHLSRRSIDMGAAVVRTGLAKAAGFRDTTHDGDATYFEDVLRAGGPGIKVHKLDRVLFVHN
jgi:glycosyltransferase involved in cell wall biosynthesis